MAPKRKNSKQVTSEGRGKSQNKRRKRSKGERPPSDEGSDDQFCNKNLTGRAFAKWKPIHRATRDFLSQMMESTISSVLANTSATSYDDVQDHLIALKSSVMKKLEQMKAPATRAADYKNLEQLARNIEGTLVKSSNKMEKLEKEVQLYESLAFQAEEDLDNYKNEVTQLDVQTDELHPLLQKMEDPVLNIPALPQINSTKTSRIINPRVLPQNLTEILDFLSSSKNSHLQKFVETLSHYAGKLDN
ncbi:centromere protein Q-like [Lingula anatina]|uniref:Centromere protein Q n=1 Tax=Lingula anatina TaxID=7574 RepID=A0A1S3HXP3_LINAN|nr:centromere protein Q-like [Lingula anatina]|eukprot:XP_013390802.1 centromere protein Q-like [Lingula anatina]